MGVVAEDVVQRALDLGIVDPVTADRMRHNLPAPSAESTWPTWRCPCCQGRGLVALDFVARRLVPAPDGPPPPTPLRRPERARQTPTAAEPIGSVVPADDHDQEATA